MAHLIQMPRRIYDQLLQCCVTKSAETLILKSGVVQNGNRNSVVHIRCDHGDVVRLLLAASEICPEAIPPLSEALTREV